MATGNSSLVSSSVRLWDRLSSSVNNGSGLVLHPETELSALVVSTGGGIVSSGNSLYADPASMWNSGLDDIVSGSYCPLVAVVSGATQYADMFVSGGTATQINLDGSTGYGTLVNVISTITSVRSVDSATNSAVPTELAVAVALAGKENILSGGSCVYINRAATSTTLGVNAVTTIRELASATDTDIPTEKAVAYALGVTLNTAQGYANNVYTTIINYNYATQSYVNQAIEGATFSLQPATNTRLGGVIIPDDHGLTITATGALSVALASAYNNYNAAAAANPAGVRVLTAISSVSTAAYLNYAYVPTVQAVWNWVSSWVADHGFTLTAADYCADKTATTPSLGGVRVVRSGGIAVTNTGTSAGNIYLTGASVFDTYANASAGAYFGGVKVMSAIAPATADAQRGLAIVPTVDAVYSALQGRYEGDFKVTYNVESSRYDIASGTVYMDGNSTAFCTMPSAHVGGGSAVELWVVVNAGGSASATAGGPVFNSSATSFPLAYVNGTGGAWQHQLGPVVVRGRWN